MSPAQSEHYAAEDSEQSWDIYRQIHEDFPDAIVIGGWGSWLHNKAAKSHDVDIIVEAPDLDRMRDALDLSESTHLGSPKWRGSYDGIHLDVYVTYRSRLGQILMLPVECLVPHRQDVEGYPTLNKEALLVAKSAARLDRPDTQPGRKDAEDMTIMLLRAPGAWEWDLVHRVAQGSQNAEVPGPALVLRAVEGLAEEAATRADRRSLRALALEMRASFSAGR